VVAGAAVGLAGESYVPTFLTGTAVLAVAVAALPVARAAAAAGAWARHLGEATVVLAVLIRAGTVIGTLAALVNGGGYGYYG